MAAKTNKEQLYWSFDLLTMNLVKLIDACTAIAVNAVQICMRSLYHKQSLRLESLIVCVLSLQTFEVALYKRIILNQIAQLVC